MSPSSGLFFWKKHRLEVDSTPVDTDVAISVRNLRKTFKKSLFSSKVTVTAIADLSFDVPKTGIFLLLGSNGYVEREIVPACIANHMLIVRENLPHYQL